MWPCLKLRHLEELLQRVDGFEQPKILLEQYVTPAHLGSHMLYTIQSQFGDISGKLVGDLGSGCGALTIGAAALGAATVIGFEIDKDALDIFDGNIEDSEFTNIDAIQCNVNYIPERWNKMFDTIIMNPPFGTKLNAGIDVKFLEKALELSNHVVYSLHKSSTRAHILKVAKAKRVEAQVVAELKYDIPSTYKFHKKKSVDVQVDLFRFNISNTS